MFDSERLFSIDHIWPGTTRKDRPGSSRRSTATSGISGWGHRDAVDQEHEAVIRRFRHRRDLVDTQSGKLRVVDERQAGLESLRRRLGARRDDRVPDTVVGEVGPQHERGTRMGQAAHEPSVAAGTGGLQR